MIDTKVYFSENERIAHEWIRSNPHQAIRYAVEAHKGYHGCSCVFNRLVISDKTQTVYVTDELNGTAQ